MLASETEKWFTTLDNLSLVRGHLELPLGREGYWSSLAAVTGGQKLSHWKQYTCTILHVIRIWSSVWVSCGSQSRHPQDCAPSRSSRGESTADSLCLCGLLLPSAKAAVGAKPSFLLLLTVLGLRCCEAFLWMECVGSSPRALLWPRSTASRHPGFRSVARGSALAIPGL